MRHWVRLHLMEQNRENAANLITSFLQVYSRKAKKQREQDYQKVFLNRLDPTSHHPPLSPAVKDLHMKLKIFRKMRIQLEKESEEDEKNFDMSSALLKTNKMIEDIGRENGSLGTFTRFRFDDTKARLEAIQSKLGLVSTADQSTSMVELQKSMLEMIKTQQKQLAAHEKALKTLASFNSEMTRLDARLDRLDNANNLQPAPGNMRLGKGQPSEPPKQPPFVAPEEPRKNPRASISNLPRWAMPKTPKPVKKTGKKKRQAYVKQTDDFLTENDQASKQLDEASEDWDLNG